MMLLSIFFYISVSALVVENHSKYLVGELPFENGCELTSYAGFLPVRNTTKAQIFFWFFPAQKPISSNPPLLIWLQGGPGSSSMIGLFTEMGPLKLSSDGKLLCNEKSWNEEFSMLFIDQPVGTGFSFVGIKGEKQVGKPTDQNLLKSKYVEKHSNDLRRCDKDPFNPFEANPKWSSKGYVTNQAAVAHDMINFLDNFYLAFPEQKSNQLYLTGESYAGKYIPSIAYNIHQINGKRTKEYQIPFAGLAIGNGLVDPITQIKSHAFQGLALGLIGKAASFEMDRYASIAVDAICRSNYNDAFEARNMLFKVFSNASGGINMYDIRKANIAYNRTAMNLFLSKNDTKKSLNVGSEAVYGKDWFLFPYLEDDIMKSSQGYFIPLLNAGYRVLLYQGQFDFRDGILGQTEWIERLQWQGQKEYLGADRTVWKQNDKVAGYVTRFENLIRVELLGCGHLCPGDVSSTKMMISDFLIV